ncbi:MAG: D-hexose-6-phosphate mutarotase [Psychromonas sp.]
MIELLDLKTVNSLSPSVILKRDNTGYEFIIIKHELFDAAFTLHGAHLIHFQVKQQEPLIWLSKSAIYNSEKAIRGGVPVCWPWFGAADPSLGENLPSHGFARTSTWDVSKISELSEGIEIEFKLLNNDETQKLWPFEFELTLKATLTNQIKLELISKNTGNKPFSYRAALHTYLNISAPESCLITGLNTQYNNSLKGGKTETGDSTLQIDQAIDAIYKKSPYSITLSDKKYQRVVMVENTGNDSEVLWTPWVQGAKDFKDMPDDGYQTMFCIEAAITDKAGVEVQPNTCNTLTTIIS